LTLPQWSPELLLPSEALPCRRRRSHDDRNRGAAGRVPFGGAALLAGEGGVPADELRRLERKLDRARGLAADAEAKEGRDAGARAWLRDLRDALYVLGDSVDDFRRAAARRHQQGRRSVRALSLPSLGSHDAEQIWNFFQSFLYINLLVFSQSIFVGY